MNNSEQKIEINTEINFKTITNLANEFFNIFVKTSEMIYGKDKITNEKIAREEMIKAMHSRFIEENDLPNMNLNSFLKMIQSDIEEDKNE